MFFNVIIYSWEMFFYCKGSRMNKIYWLLIICVCQLSTLSSQTVAVKTNLLYDATTTINLEGEVKLAARWTLGLSGNYNPWTFSEDKKNETLADSTGGALLVV